MTQYNYVSISVQYTVEKQFLNHESPVHYIEQNNLKF